MKNLITSVASMLLLLAVLMEFTQSQLLYVKMTAADQAAAAFRDMVKVDGCITDTSESWLRQELAKVFHCAQEEITLRGTRTPVGRGQPTSYQVEVKVKPVIIMAKFWNIDSERNYFEYRLDRTVVSEREVDSP
ncbi:hypothetical protein D1155_12605 [Anaerotruncus sp. 80]|uniref:DUF4320 family protein n=1 Tax=Anaerotruncus colihominis TaxID=169435 RepID=A0A845QR37_9FIRM|nr:MULTISPECIES: hypothetical protein [Anaerotruncus]NBH62488.1 hypothetical protein [Anaerotruncus colihominis]NCF03143.1 hypothetical protein [Anaerotruncus sp. 80]